MTTIEPYLDGATVLLFALFARLLLAILFFGFWFRSRRSVWFLWWSTSLLFGCVGAGIIIARGFRAELFGLGIAVACLIASFGSCWTGARVFERRSPLWSPVLVAITVWLAASLMPSFFQNDVYRVVLSSLVLGAFPALTAFEFWRGRAERLPSRWVIVALFASLSLVFFVRIPLVSVAPFPFGAQPANIVWTSAFNMALFFHTVILVVLLVALTKERLELEQRMAAYTDALTGASNRRAFTVRGRRLLSRHERNRHQLCVLFLDIDDFKQINDRFGHAGGDAVLKRFVEIVLDNIRPTDFLFRIGGEEFCCLLPQTGLQQGEHVAERIRSHVEKATFDVARSQARSTVSIGVASTASAGYDLDVLVHAADEAVYAAKRQGRNRVVTAGTQERAAVVKLVRPG